MPKSKCSNNHVWISDTNLCPKSEHVRISDVDCIVKLTHNDEGPVVQGKREHDQGRQTSRNHSNSPERLQDHPRPRQFVLVFTGHAKGRAVGGYAPAQRYQ